MITIHICTAPERGVLQAADAGGFSLPLREAQENGGFSILERIDESVIAPGIRLDRHAHRDVELLTYVVEGCLDYRDQTGTRELVLGGEIQSVQTGEGLVHSEANASHAEELHLIQAVLRLEHTQSGAAFRSRYYSDDARLDRLCCVASGSGAEGALDIAADAEVYAAVIRPGEPLLYYRPRGRRVWLQVARGLLLVNEVLLSAGDAAAIDGEDDTALRLLARDECELLLFELP